MERLKYKFVNKYKFNSILFINFMKFLLIMFAILCVSCIMFYYSVMRISENEIMAYNENNAKNIIQSTQNVIDQIRNITVNMAADPEIRNYTISDNYENVITNYKQKLITKLSAYKSMTKCIHSIYIYNDKRRSVLTNADESTFDKFEDNEWLDEYRQNTEDTMRIFPRRINGYYPYAMTFLSCIPGKGCIVVNADIYNIGKNTVGSLDKKSAIYLTDSFGRIIYSNSEENFMKSLDELPTGKIKDNGICKIDDETYYRYSVKNGDNTYTVINLIDDYTNSTGASSLVLVLSMLFALVVGVVIAGLLAVSSFEPISKIMKVIDNSDAGNVINELENNEVKYIATTIIQYIDSNLELKNELNKKLIEYNQISIIAMQNQINPHFINNTLNLILLNMVQETGVQSNSAKMIVSMTRIIQYILNTETIQVDFKQEIDFLRKYVEFLRYRYRNVNVIWDIDAQMYSYKILRVCLQPIVENAVYHGLSSLNRPGVLKISAKIENNEEIITVEDNGEGMEETKVFEVLDNMKKTDLDSKHIGLRNVYRRLKIVYGEKCDIRIESIKSKFTRVSIVISINIAT